MISEEKVIVKEPIKFATIYDFPEAPISNSGSKFKKTYVKKTKKDGSVYLEETGEHNVYADIQSHLNSCNLEHIIQRAKEGDESVLKARVGVFGDLANLPDNIHDINNIINVASQEFYKLPVELREYFNQSPINMINSYDKGQMPSILEKYFKKVNPEYFKKKEGENKQKEGESDV